MPTTLAVPTWMPDQEAFDRAAACLKYYRERTGWDQFVIDDGSPVAYTSSLQHAFPHLTILRFPVHYGRTGILNYLFIWRALYAVESLFNLWERDKVALTCVDFYMLSERMIRYVGEEASGWTTFWCPGYGFAETACQVIATDCLEYRAFVAGGSFHRHDGILMETALPFTEVNKTMMGDRYGERPRDQWPQTIDGLDFWA